MAYHPRLNDLSAVYGLPFFGPTVLSGYRTQPSPRGDSSHRFIVNSDMIYRYHFTTVFGSFKLCDPFLVGHEAVMIPNVPSARHPAATIPSQGTRLGNPKMSGYLRPRRG